MLTEHQESRLREAVVAWEKKAELHRKRALAERNEGEKAFAIGRAQTCEILGFREIVEILNEAD